MRFIATFLPLRPYCEKISTCLLNDADILATYGCTFWCSQIVHKHTYSLNTAIVLDCVTESSYTSVVWGVCMPQYFRTLPGLDQGARLSVLYSGFSVVPSFTGYRIIMLKKCLQLCFSTSKLAINRSVSSVFINLHRADCVCLYSMELASVTKPKKYKKTHLPRNRFVFSTYLNLRGGETKENYFRGTWWRKG